MTPAVVLEPAIPDMETPSFYIVMLEVLPIVYRCQMVHFSSQRPDLPQHAKQEPANPRSNLSERQKWTQCLEVRDHRG